MKLFTSIGPPAIAFKLHSPHSRLRLLATITGKARRSGDLDLVAEKMVVWAAAGTVELAAARQRTGSRTENVQDEELLAFGDDQGDLVEVYLAAAESAVRKLTVLLLDEREPWPPSKIRSRLD
jgi:hypothetical protein